MQIAFQSGTDNEAYGALARFWDGDVHMGCDLPPVAYCPWCGKETKLLNTATHENTT